MKIPQRLWLTGRGEKVGDWSEVVDLKCGTRTKSAWDTGRLSQRPITPRRTLGAGRCQISDEASPLLITFSVSQPDAWTLSRADAKPVAEPVPRRPRRGRWTRQTPERRGRNLVNPGFTGSSNADSFLVERAASPRPARPFFFAPTCDSYTSARLFLPASHAAGATPAGRCRFLSRQPAAVSVPAGPSHLIRIWHLAIRPRRDTTVGPPARRGAALLGLGDDLMTARSALAGLAALARPPGSPSRPCWGLGRGGRRAGRGGRTGPTGRVVAEVIPARPQDGRPRVRPAG